MSKEYGLQLLSRNSVILSQLLFWKFLNTDMINKLINLFGMPGVNGEIVHHIATERAARGLDMCGVVISSHVYGFDNKNSTIILEIVKNGIAFLHLSIHLRPTAFNSKSAGPIHMRKEIYSTYSPKPPRKTQYVSIFVCQPKDKPNSLEFAIINQSTSALPITHVHECELRDEMDVIIAVLNRLFDQDNKAFYIGDVDILAPVHNTTDAVLKNIDAVRTHVTRKNVGYHKFECMVCKVGFYRFYIP